MNENISLSICRVCMHNGDDNLDLESLFTPMNGGFVANVFSDCTSIPIMEGDLMPQFICKTCLKQLILSSDFIKKARASDKILRQLNCVVSIPLINIEKNENEIPFIGLKMEVVDPSDELLEVQIFKESDSEHENLDFEPDYSDDPDYDIFDGKNNDNVEIVDQSPIKRRKRARLNQKMDNNKKKKEYNFELTEIKIDGHYCCRAQCLQFFSSAEELEDHVKAKHTNAYFSMPISNGKPAEKCSVCHSNFADNKVYKAHIKCRDNEEFILECKICKARFWKSRVHSAKRHYKNHFDEANVKSEVAENSKPVDLEASMEKLINCENLDPKEHLTEIEITGLYCCRPKCYTIFNTQDELDIHIIETHTDSYFKNPQKSVGKCETCHINFQSQRVMKLHNELKKNEKYFLECKMCKIRFWQNRYDCARKHIQKIHFSNLEQTQQNDEDDQQTGDEPDPLLYLKEVEITSPYYCCQNKCFQTFSTQEEMVTHLKDSHEYSFFREFDQTEMVGKCTFCYSVFKNPDIFKTHIKAREDEKVFLECKICKAKFWSSRFKSARKHVREHFKKKPVASSHKIQQTKYDINEFRQRLGWICCSQGCWSSFETEEALLTHAKSTHVEINRKKEQIYKDKMPFPCPICYKRFDEENKVIRHRKRKYLQQNVAFACEICGLVVRKTEMEIHKLKHNKNKDYICDICDSAFYTKAKLKAHLNTHVNERPFVCPTCGYAFKKKGYLKTHMRRHLPDSSVFKCNLCPAKFQDKFKLKQHERIHTGEKPFSCRYCELAFADKSNRRVHEMGHTGIYPYNCSICNRGFTRKSFFKQHHH